MSRSTIQVIRRKTFSNLGSHSRTDDEEAATHVEEESR